ncbi:hypothetical protein [Methylovirgula sp. 4M-Z18]|uniref:hypothetical protein n=1 Tax=Methylovirgula sp. 4M-Z18 TaxID=2293567 RepID=UPI000E2EF276|nr:hypothetical protein [Methylovirgula sp. 4M-Z18]RFB78643.1 hypothetical protein DYH55_15685 [Methylovirgula sp. 4M-Z18]
MSHFIVLLGSCLNLIGTWRYCRAILAGRVQPNLVTWIMWALAPLIGVAAELYSGVTWAVLPVFMAGFGPLCVTCVALLTHHSTWVPRPRDYACGVFSFLALILWQITKDPDIAILFAVLSDGAALLPTLFKTWTHPDSETPVPFALAVCSSLSALPVIEHWTFASLAFPLYLMTANSIMVLTIERRRFLTV